MPKSLRLNRIKRGPLFAGAWGDAAAPGFGLEPSDMPRIAAHLPGCAVTVEHGGLHEAISTLDRLDERVSGQNLLAALQATPSGAKRPVGTVLESGPDASVVVHIDPNLPAVASLVRSGELRGLSLTTVAESGEVAMPVELTLCGDPARGIEAAVLSDEYKLQEGTLVKTSMEATPTPPVAEKTSLEAAIDSLPEKDREAVIARLQEYETKRSVDGKALEELEAALKTRDTMLGKQNTDREVLLAQFDLLKQRLDGVDGVNLEGCREALSEPNRTEQMNDFTMGRIIEACSRGLQAQKATAAAAAPAAGAAPAAKKRKIPDSSDGEGLRNLLRANF